MKTTAANLISLRTNFFGKKGYRCLKSAEIWPPQLSDLQPDGTVGLEEFLPRSIRNIRANKRKERFMDEWKKKRR